MVKATEEIGWLFEFLTLIEDISDFLSCCIQFASEKGKKKFVKSNFCQEKYLKLSLFIKYKIGQQAKIRKIEFLRKIEICKIEIRLYFNIHTYISFDEVELNFTSLYLFK